MTLSISSATHSADPRDGASSPTAPMSSARSETAENSSVWYGVVACRHRPHPHRRSKHPGQPGAAHRRRHRAGRIGERHRRPPVHAASHGCSIGDAGSLIGIGAIVLTRAHRPAPRRRRRRPGHRGQGEFPDYAMILGSPGQGGERSRPREASASSTARPTMSTTPGATATAALHRTADLDLRPRPHLPLPRTRTCP